jgi:hypothetical protein
MLHYSVVYTSQEGQDPFQDAAQAKVAIGMMYFVGRRPAWPPAGYGSLAERKCRATAQTRHSRGVSQYKKLFKNPSFLKPLGFLVAGPWRPSSWCGRCGLEAGGNLVLLGTLAPNEDVSALLGWAQEVSKMVRGGAPVPTQVPTIW